VPLSYCASKSAPYRLAGGLSGGGLLQDLGEARRRVQHVVAGDAVHGLGHAVARAVVREACCQGAAHHLGEPVGVVVGVAAQAVRKQACPELVEGLPLSSQL
jgi:hypothetical protein